MRIGINTLFLIPGKVGGTETYARGLITSLKDVDKKNKYQIFCNLENYSTFTLISGNFEKVSTPVKASMRPFRIIWEQLIFPFKLRQRKVDVLLSLGYVCPLFVPCKSVVVIFDLNWFFHPEEFSMLSRLFWKALVTSSAKRADKIITSSENSKRDIAKVLNIPEGKIEVVYGGINKESIISSRGKIIQKTEKKYGINGRFILTVSAAYKFKNLSKLIDAFNLVSKKIPDLQLLIVGLGGRGKHEALKKINDYNLEGKVIIAGWVPDKDIPALYRAAVAYVHPSLYEGFGFPVLEAMNFGCPVVSSRSASLPEIVEGAGILVDAESPKELALGIEKSVSNKKMSSKMIKDGIKRSRQFSWINSARQTVKTLEEVS